MSEQRIVHHALRQIGFVGLGPLDWIHRSGEITCAIPKEETRTFNQAIRFLREGAFQRSLQNATRLTYYRLASALESWCRFELTKGIHGNDQRPRTG